MDVVMERRFGWPGDFRALFIVTALAISGTGLACGPSLVNVHDAGARRDVPYLVQALQEYDRPWVVADAARALGGSGSPAAIEPLKRVLGRGSAPWTVRQAAAEALGDLGDPAGEAALREAFARAGHIEERLAIVIALGRLCPRVVATRSREATVALLQDAGEDPHPLLSRAGRYGVRQCRGKSQ